MVLIKNVPFDDGNNPWKFRFDISKGLETVRVDGKGLKEKDANPPPNNNNKKKKIQKVIPRESFRLRRGL